MAVENEKWARDIEEKLFEGADFIGQSRDHSEFIDGKFVHVPQGGDPTSITKNRSSYPATITRRTDDVLDYQINGYDIAPQAIPDIEEVQTSYMKRDAIMGTHIAALTDRIALEVAFAWAATEAANIVRTSGAAGTEALAPGATGNRLATVKADIKNLAKAMDLQKITRNNRNLLMDAQMYWQLFDDDTVVSRDFAEGNAQVTGVVNQLHGFNIFVRAEGVVYTNAATPVKKAIGAATAATDNLSCIAWQSDKVASALGDITVYSEEEKADWFGSVVSAMVMHGASKLRTDEAGLATLVQGT